MPESVQSCDKYAFSVSINCYLEHSDSNPQNQGDTFSIDIKESLGIACFENMKTILSGEGLTLDTTLTPVNYDNADLAFSVTSRACVALGYAKAVR